MRLFFPVHVGAVSEASGDHSLNGLSSHEQGPQRAWSGGGLEDGVVSEAGRNPVSIVVVVGLQHRSQNRGVVVHGFFFPTGSSALTGSVVNCSRRRSSICTDKISGRL